MTMECYCHDYPEEQLSWENVYAYNNDWKRLTEDDPSMADMETLLKGVCNKQNYLDLFENYTLFNG